MSIGIAIIGSGIFVQEEHLPNVKACSTVSLKAIYSRSLKSAKALETEGVDLYSDDAGVGKTYHDLLLRTDIHAVIVALPILTQPEFIEAALAAGKHVLSEKPIAKDIKSAQQLIAYYKSDKVKGGATWAVAENFRYVESFEYARQEVQKLGRILGFRIKMFGNVRPGGKYFETPWRKVPDYQGGFLLDGGVHFIAATRLLLGDASKPTGVSAYTALLQEHLPPVDTVNSIWHTKSGISGTFSVSFGIQLWEHEYFIACEKGSITIAKGRETKVIVRGAEDSGVESSEKDYKGEESGVGQEIAAWAKSILDGRPDPRQSPEEAFADLEILEMMLKSGEASGQPQGLNYQV